MSVKTVFYWTKLNKAYAKWHATNPKIPERTQRGTLTVSEAGLEVCPEDDFYGGTVTPEDAVKLAKEILARHDPAQRVPLKLVIACVECGKTCEASFDPYDSVSFTAMLYREHHWFLSVVSPPGSGEAVLAPLCGICSATHLAPELIAEFKRQHGEGGDESPKVTTSKIDDRYGKTKS